MIIEEKLTKQLDTSLLQAMGIDVRSALFFDIETTGFTAKTSKLYMIGVLYYKKEENAFYAKQWFAETYEEAPQILLDFMEFSKQYSALVHYNGDGFDLPYVKDACQQYAIPYTLEHLQSFDIYKLIRSYKDVLMLERVKQKNVEEFLGIYREDEKNGGELIKVYQDYVTHPTEEAKHLLLLHNYDDIIGMPDILPILAYPLLLNNTYKVTKIKIADDTAIIELQLDYAVPKRISVGQNGIRFTANKSNAYLYIPIYTGEVKYFYPNYKDYYYLPLEDTAVHKSVAFYVDKDYRTQAKAATCYSKKTGVFLPQPEPVIAPYFKLEYNDKMTYFELSEEHMENYDDMYSYAKTLIAFIFKK